MGVKSTQYLTYEQAIDKFIYLRQKQMERVLKAESFSYDKRELENVLEDLNDAYHGGEGFENYIITDGPEF